MEKKMIKSILTIICNINTFCSSSKLELYSGVSSQQKLKNHSGCGVSIFGQNSTNSYLSLNPNSRFDWYMNSDG